MHTSKRSTFSTLIAPNCFFTTVIATFALLTLGCGKPSDGRVKALGTVLLDGQPLTHDGEGLFIINLANESNTITSTAKFSKTDGTFEIVIQPGDYVAVVTATDGFDQDDERRGRVIPAKSLVPEKYRSLKTSDANVTVPETGGELTVALTSE